MIEAELNMLTIQKVYGLKFLAEGKTLGVIDDDYIQKYVARSLAEIEGVPVETHPALPAKSAETVEAPMSPPAQERVNIRTGEFLLSKGLPREQAMQASSFFGRRVRERYTIERGGIPNKQAGRSGTTYVYTEDDLPILEHVFKEMFNGASVAGHAIG